MEAAEMKDKYELLTERAIAILSPFRGESRDEEEIQKVLFALVKTVRQLRRDQAEIQGEIRAIEAGVKKVESLLDEASYLSKNLVDRVQTLVNSYPL